jgi:gliding motility associated protien GldN
MIKQIARLVFLMLVLVTASQVTFAQKGKKKAKTATRAKKTRTAKNKTTANVRNGEATGDATTQGAAEPVNDSLPIKKVAKSLRRDAAVDDDAIKDRTPLAYEHLRAEDAVYRHKIWREIDAREKINLPFRYAADENNGNQRFIMILLKAIQDDAVTVFSAIDDRFTTPMTKSEVAAVVAGEPIKVDEYNEKGEIARTVLKRNEVNWDSVYKFHIKEEVVFDKESSRLFFRILGIAPVKKSIIGSTGIDVGDIELFWVYYPDMRETFSKYEVYNGKNYGARMSWEELFESRMFNGRIIKSTIDNPYDLYIKNYKGLQDNTILQLFEGETIKEKIFNYEQDLWAY